MRLRRTMRPSTLSSTLASASPADVRKNCALITLHVMAEETMGGDGFRVPEVEEEWKIGCPNSPMWEREGEVWSEDESVSSGG